MNNERQNRLDQILGRIQSNCNPTNGSDQCNKFSLDCIALIEGKLPPIAVNALSVLVDFLEGHSRLEDVVQVEAKLWDYLRKDRRDQDYKDPEVNAIRALIFPLDAQENSAEQDILDHLGFFLEFVNNVEPHYDEEEVLLRKHFEDCLKPK